MSRIVHNLSQKTVARLTACKYVRKSKTLAAFEKVKLHWRVVFWESFPKGHLLCANIATRLPTGSRSRAPSRLATTGRGSGICFAIWTNTVEFTFHRDMNIPAGIRV